MKPRDFKAEDRNRATTRVVARLYPEDYAKVEAVRALGYSMAEIVLAGCEVLQAKSDEK